MYKILGILVLLVIGYMLFIHESSPKIIHFNGQEYGPSQLDRSNDSNSKIYNYYSKLVSNKDYISVLHPDSGTGSLSEWSDLFSQHFEKQGFKFSGDRDNKVGVKQTVKLFMMPSQQYNVVFMYILENTENSDHLEEDRVFEQLKEIKLD